MSDDDRPFARALAASPGIMVAVVVLAYAVMASVAHLVVGAVPTTAPNDPRALVDYVETALTGQLVAATVPLVLLLCWPGPPRAIGRLGAGILGWYFACLVVWLPIAFWLHPMLLRAFEVSMSAQPHLEYFVVDAVRPGLWIAIAVVCVLGPIAEEILFRGFLQTGLRGVLGRWPALWVTAILFGLMHGLQYALPLALLGGLFGYLRERYAGLAAPILAHVLHNSLTVAAATWFPELLRDTYPR